jgi:tripartite-type tricarboxylate transporter receptor subunit TctC
VPTTAEVGLPTVQSDNWYGLAAPAGVAKPILDRIHAAAVAVLGTKEAAEPMLAQGAVIRPMTPAEFADFIQQEREKWGPVVKASGAKME